MTFTIPSTASVIFLQISFRGKSCSFTIPVTYANRRGTYVFFIESTIHIVPIPPRVRILLPYRTSWSLSIGVMRCTKSRQASVFERLNRLQQLLTRYRRGGPESNRRI